MTAEKTEEKPVQEETPVQKTKGNETKVKIKGNETKIKIKEDKTNIQNKNWEIERQKFPIVGIGASAGGLDALKNFFSYMPPDAGVGFVLVQHLDPTHKSSMVELLSKYTSMEVVQVKDGMEVKPDQVHIIPPNKEMVISKGILHLSTPSEPHGLRMPINVFLKSLAEDQKDNSICIILSGFGADGATGLKAIKSEGGMAMVQDPKTAEADGMPISAINTGLVDFVLSTEDMPDKLIYYVTTSRKILKKIMVPEGKTEVDLQRIFQLIRARTGHDFSNYKESTMYRRIGKRANLHQIDDIKEYARYLERKPDEVDHLFQELLINVTSFFRDPEAFDIIRKQVLPEMMAGKSEGDAIRIWVPGCSSGEEVYSLAMMLRETMEALGKYFEVQMFGTDIDDVAIDIARKGVYPENIQADVGQDRLKRFFIRKDGEYQVKNEIREMAVFAVHNVLKDPPFAKLDLISCRNLLIYLKSDAQKSLLSIFNYALNIDGILFLGPSESIGESMEHYQVLDKKWKIFKSEKTRALPWRMVESPLMFSPYAERALKTGTNLDVERIDVTNLATKQLLDVYVPPSVIINDLGEIIYIHGRMGKYLEPAPGTARLNLYDMAKDGISFKLRTAVQNATSKKKDVILERLSVKNNGDTNIINITVKPIKEPEIMRNLLIVSFEDVSKLKTKEKEKIKLDVVSEADKRVDELDQELRETKERLNVTIEEMETSYEELKAANEELQSMNEESQSTNEELETSKEEMQSINEELATVNSELQTKIDELTRANDDMKNLFNSTEIATVFLDKELNIRNFTPESSALFKLRKLDAGRPIGDIVSNLKYEHLEEDIKKVLDKLALKEKEVQTTVGTWYLMRITPYRTSEDLIDGVVVTFLDINDRKQGEKKVHEALEYSDDIIDTVREPLIVLDENLKVKSANKSFYKKFKVDEKDTEGKLLYNLGNNQWDIPKLRTLLEKILPENMEFKDFEVEHEFPGIGLKRMILNARRIYHENVGTQMILLAIEDATGLEDITATEDVT